MGVGGGGNLHIWFLWRVVYKGRHHHYKGGHHHFEEASPISPLDATDKVTFATYQLIAGRFHFNHLDPMCYHPPPNEA